MHNETTMKRYLYIFLCLGSSIYLPLASLQATVYKVADPALQMTGSWANTSQSVLPRLDIALAVANAGDTIWVVAGTYSPDLSIPSGSFYLPNNRTLIGGFRPSGDPNINNQSDRDPAAYPTILSGQNEIYHVITCDSTGNGSLLDGFIIEKGNADGSSSTQAGVGGGVYLNHASPIFRNCVFRDNQASFGGAIYMESSSEPIIENCEFFSDTATIAGGAIYAYYFCYPKLSNSTFDSNTALSNGGALCLLQTSIDAQSCIFTNNTATLGAGGAVYSALLAGIQEFDNSIFHLNIAQNGGGLASELGPNILVSNCDFHGNISNQPNTFGAFYSNSQGLRVVNSIIWDNLPVGLPTNMTVLFSIVEGGFENGLGIFDSDPQFVNPYSGSAAGFELMECSPAIDWGGFPRDSAYMSTLDFTGSPRETPGSCNLPFKLDMGAIEFQSYAPPINLNATVEYDTNYTQVDTILNTAIALTCVGEPISLFFNISGGCPPYLIAIPNPDTNRVDTIQNYVSGEILSFFPTQSGLFPFLIWDAKGCQFPISPPINVSINSKPPSPICDSLPRQYTLVDGLVTLDPEVLLKRDTSGCPLDTMWTTPGILTQSDIAFNPIEVELTVVNFAGDTGRCSSWVSVFCHDSIPQVNFEGYRNDGSRLNLWGVPDTLCIGETIRLNNLSSPRNYFRSVYWDLKEDGYSEAYELSAEFYYPGHRSISLTLTDVSGCTATDTAYVYVSPRPYLHIKDSLDTLVFGTTTTIGIERGVRGYGKWITEIGNGSIVSPMFDTTRVTGLSEGSHLFTYELNQEGCIVSKQVRIERIPWNNNFVITPNGDSFNDRLQIEGLFAEHEYLSLLAYSSRGDLIFSAPYLGSDWQGWEGIDNNGRQVPEDTYHLILTFPDETKEAVNVFVHY